MTARGEERRWLDVDSGASGELRALLESARDDGGEREQIERIRGRLGVLIGPAFGGEGPPTPPEPGPPQAPDASPAPAAAPPAAPAPPPPPPLGATAGKVAFGKALALKPLLVGISIGALGGSAVTWQVSSALHAPVAASASAAVSAAPKGVRVAPAMPPRTDDAPVAPPAVPAAGTPVEVARVDEGALAAKGPAEAATLAEPGQAPGLEPLAPIAPIAPSAPGGPPGALPVAPAPTGGETPASSPIAAQTPASPPIAAQAPASPPASTTIANADAAVKPPAIVAAGPPAAPRTAPNTPANEVPWAIFDDPYLALPTPPSSAPAAATPGRPLAPAAATPGRPTAPAAALPG
ncbi:MAG: hypothetical protein MUF34_29960, partial [Polyangiaceae bacterium]|nr:hypothetical protein [Polyangiaceae bacterium]